MKRVLTFNKQDWKHIGFLTKNMFIQFFKGDLAESYEAWMWIKVHFSYDSTRKEVGD